MLTSYCVTSNSISGVRNRQQVYQRTVPHLSYYVNAQSEFNTDLAIIQFVWYMFTFNDDPF